MKDVWQVVLVLIGMACVTFISGYLPNLCTNKKNLNLVAVFGGGILLGAALLIVLPESVKVMVETNYQQNQPTKVEEVFPESLVLQIGLSVMSGFLMMLLIEELVEECKICSEKETIVLEVKDGQESLLPKEQQDDTAETQKKSGALVTTVGLCVHSLAEGVAMGSSQFSNFLLFIPLVSAQSITHSGLGLTVVIALFLHKIPEGIGFGSFLTFKEPGKIQIIACLTVRILNMTIQAYSVASPISALITFLTLTSISQDSSVSSLNYWTGLALLVSVGTFLYVSTIHILPEVFPKRGHDHGPTNLERLKTENSNHNHLEMAEPQNHGRLAQLSVLILGLFMPLLLLTINDH